MRRFIRTRLKYNTPASSRLCFAVGSNVKPSLGFRKGSAGPSCPLYEQWTMFWAILHRTRTKHP